MYAFGLHIWIYINMYMLFFLFLINSLLNKEKPHLPTKYFVYKNVALEKILNIFIFPFTKYVLEMYVT